jgi:hypothetical protein
LLPLFSACRLASNLQINQLVNYLSSTSQEAVDCLLPVLAAPINVECGGAKLRPRRGLVPRSGAVAAETSRGFGASFPCL